MSQSIPKPTPPATSQPTVLIVDDDPLIRLQACGFLSQAGFNPAEAATGSEALTAIDSFTPDLFVLDVEMPGINGFDVCRQIRLQQRFSHTPILMLTGLNDRESIDEAYIAGATDFSVKPINWLLLSHRLRYMHRASLAAEKIHQLAYFDTLTNLPNRTLFQEQLEKAMHTAHTSKQQLAILYFDLNDFKNINDNFGHTIGDKLLQEVGNRVSTGLRAGTIGRPIDSSHYSMARMGGDEFTVLLKNIENVSNATDIAEQIIDVISKPIQLDEHELFTSASIGISIYQDNNACAELLLKNADMAMYEAKRMGKSSYMVHSEQLEAKGVRRFQIDAEMRLALERSEFSIHYQPQLDLAQGKLYSAEALLRWTNSTLGSVSPAEFISIAEDNGMIVNLGEWVLRSACAQMRRWQQQGFEIQDIAINVSALQFMRSDFPEIVSSALNDADLPANNLELEITESLLASNITHAVDTLNKLKTLGVQLSIDDFGTGYSSLSQLKRFPIDRLKIDQSFIRNVVEDNSDASITRAVIAMSKSMGINVLAEGVESSAQLEFLRQNNCNEIQGYYISKPQSAKELEYNMPELLAVIREHFPPSTCQQTESNIHHLSLSSVDPMRKTG